MRRRLRGDFPRLLLLLILLFALAGCFSPTRYQLQHFYAIAPLMVLATAHGLAAVRARARLAHGLFAGLVLASLALGLPEYGSFDDWTSFEQWTTVKIHRSGEEMARLAGPGKILTLAPIWAIEGGNDIYPEFATGPFAWRLAHLLPADRRARMRLVGPDDLAARLAGDPPVAVLLGAEPANIEEGLAAYAGDAGWRPLDVQGKLRLCVPHAR